MGNQHLYVSVLTLLYRIARTIGHTLVERRDEGFSEIVFA